MASSDARPTARHPWFDASATPRVLAHRGLTLPGAEHAENTAAAVVSAVSAGVVHIESDCHLTRDGDVVLFHDDTVERITGDPRPVAEIDVRELRRMMADLGGLLTLREALEGFPDVRWNIDVKAAAAAGAVGMLIAPHTPRVLVTSFSDSRRKDAIAAARRAGAAIRPATSGGTSVVGRAVAARGVSGLFRRAVRGVDALQIPERQGPVRVLSPGLVRAAHRVGVEVHVWTVNDPERMTALVEMGVDGIVTDRADLALDVL